MANDTISQVKLPDGNVYDIVDQTVTITSTYDSTEKNLTLIVGSLVNADLEEY